MSLFALFRRKWSRKLPRGERFYVYVGLARECGFPIAIYKRPQGRISELPSIEVAQRDDYNAVRVAGKIAKMLNAGKLK